MSLYVWGSNKSKQLNNQKELHSYAPVYIPSTCGDNVPTAVASGDSHTIVLCDSGDIYTFGRDREGQLGHGSGGADCAEARVVAGLNEETVIDIAAGALSSFAVTSTGNVYQWGLIFRKMRDAQDHNEGLHGLAQDQDTVFVEADIEAREEEAAAQNTSAATPAGMQAYERRQLRDIVQDSTEQWQLPTIEADIEYTEELHAIGLVPEEVKLRMAARQREYKQMLAMGCTRGAQYLPMKIPNIDHIRVKSVSAGYSHVMLLSDEGRLYGAGYNDRGQLGLGHRINSSEFKPLDFLANKFVIQVACGQQHSVCRAIGREQLHLLQDAGERGDVVVGSDCGADAYVWGNGTLGQLGLGILGTTKGRLFPTRNTALFNLYPLGIVSVSAGANFTAAVTTAGSVYSFGHSEYNQHGDKTGAHQDYAHAHYYFVPRKVSIEAPKPPAAVAYQTGSAAKAAKMHTYIHIKSITCGAAFSIAVDLKGDMYSWGWNESGVLGHGVRHFASSPQRVEKIGTGFDGCPVRAVCAGAKHVVAITAAQGHAWASSFHSILEFAKHVDCLVCIEDHSHALASKFSSARQTEFPCHRAILSARCPFLRGFINTALRATGGNGVLRITLPSSHANAITVRSLLDYLYLDRIQIVGHKREELRQLAEDLNLDRLLRILSKEKNPGSAPTSHTIPSTFTENLTQLFNCPENADVVFVVPRPGGGAANAGGPGRKWYGEEEDESDIGTEVTVFDPAGFEFVLYAHRAVIGTRLPYFETLLSGGFAESRNRVKICAPFGGPQSVAVQIDVSGLQMEGIELPILQMVMLYAYTGHFHSTSGKESSAMEEVDLNEVMAVLVAANRLGFATLVQHCERLLSMHLTDFFPQNAENCLEFAVAYNIPRLERQCREVLSKAPAKLAESRHAHAHAQGKSAAGVSGVSGATEAAGDSGVAARKPWV